MHEKKRIVIIDDEEDKAQLFFKCFDIGMFQND
jgi:hypothetical protein